MRLSSVVLVLLVVVFALISQPVHAQEPMPRMTVVEPDNGSAGDTISVSGENLEATYVAELYLTDGKTDFKVEITAQAADSITFTIPASAKAGRWSLMVLTKGATPRFIEQPVKVTVE